MEDFGAAQPIKDAFGKKKDTPPPAKSNTAWHDDKVKAANDAFRKKQGSKKETDMPDKKKGYDPREKNELPGGSYRRRDYMPGKFGETIGDKAGSSTLKEGNKQYGNYIYDSPDRTRAYTPQEAQKAQSSVDQKKMRDQANDAPGGKIPSYKKGGKIKATGLAKVHKGERVIPKAKVAKVEKLMRKRG